MAETAQQGTIKFKCPKCLNYEITRTAHEKKMAAKYHCPECGFEGPN